MQIQEYFHASASLAKPADRRMKLNQSSTWKLLQQREYNKESVARLRFDRENAYQSNPQKPRQENRQALG
jgi:hypothetical protein